MAQLEQTANHNWPVYGHNWAVDYLRKGMIHNRVRHAYLVTGTPSIGKTQFAHAFAMALNCEHEDIAQRPCGECRSCKLIRSGNHPDMVYSELDDKTGALKIDTLRSVMQRIALKPYQARYRIAIISDFDRARFSTQDAILKTLEEPPPHALLILLTPSTENIMPTIISRCQVIHLRPVAANVIASVLVDQLGADADHAALLSRLSSGRIGWAIEAVQNVDTLEQRNTALNLLDDILTMNRSGRFKVADDLGRDKQSLQPLLELWQSYWRDIVLMAEGAPVKPCHSDRLTQMQQLLYTVSAEQALTALKATQDLIKTLQTNANPRLALEVMFLDYPGLP